MNETNSTALATSGKSEIQTLNPEAKLMEYSPWGSNDKVKLSVSIVKTFLAEPTKSGKLCSERDATRFMMFCLARRQNPFEGDCYLVGYDTNVNGNSIAKYSMITAEQVFLKRAEVHPQFDGMESGLWLINGEEEKQIEGEIFRPPWQCIGGWARVYRKDRRVPYYDSLLIVKMRGQSPFWERNAEHQIVKCARVAVLRRAFASQLGGMYLREENDGRGDFLDTSVVSSLPPETPSAPIEVESAGTPVRMESPGASPEKKSVTPQLELREFVTGECSMTFAQFHAWAVEGGQFGTAEPENINSFQDVPTDIAKRLLKAKAGMKQQLEMMRAKEAK